MSVLVLIFWTSLLVPGYAIARRVDPDGVRSGLFGAIALSFVAAATALSAVAIPGYLIGAPLALLSVAIVALVVWGAVDLVRTTCGREIGGLLVGALGLQLVLVLADVVLGARVGTPLGADAVVHVGRIRFLLDHGLMNLDQYAAEPYFYPIYHTNILHALVACAAQITRVDHLGAWYGSLAAAKMLVASGAWYAGWAIFRSGPAGWAAALFVLGHRGPVTFLAYPNQIAPWFLVPMLVASATRAVTSRDVRAPAIGVGAAALLIGETHGMYGAFVVMTLGPFLALLALWRWRRGEASPRAALACAAALAVTLPFPLVTYAAMRSAAAARPPAAAASASEATEDEGQADAPPVADDGGTAEDAMDDDAAVADDAGAGAAPDRRGRGGAGAPRSTPLSNRFRTFENGWVMHRLGRGFTGGRGFRVLLLLFAIPLAALAGRRREITVPAGMLAAVAAWLYLPPVCAVLARVAGAEWMIHRFASLQDVLFALIVPGSVAAAAVAAAERGPEPEAGRTHVALTAFHWAFGAFCIYAGAYCAHLSAPYTWSRYLDRAFEPLSTRHGRELRPLRRYAEDLLVHVPPGAVVLAEPSIGTELVMLHDCRIVASDSSSVGVPFLRRRTADVRRMLANETDAADRDALIDRYRVTHVVVPRPAKRWVYDRMSEFWVTEFGRCIIALRPPGAPWEEVLGDYDRALLDAGLPVEAIGWLAREIERRPQDFGLRFRLGNALLGEGRLEEALEAFRAAQRLRPDDPRAAIMVGNALSELGWCDEAIRAYEETIEIAERTGNRDAIASGWFNLGNMQYRVREWAKAAEAYRAALEVRPRHEGAGYWLGEAAQRAAEEAAGTAPPGAAPPPADDS